jgi:hypothetical protein
MPPSPARTPLQATCSAKRGAKHLDQLESSRPRFSTCPRLSAFFDTSHAGVLLINCGMHAHAIPAMTLSSPAAQMACPCPRPGHKGRGAGIGACSANAPPRTSQPGPSSPQTPSGSSAPAPHPCPLPLHLLQILAQHGRPQRAGCHPWWPAALEILGARQQQAAGAAQHSTAQHSTAQHSTAQHSTAQHSTWGWHVSLLSNVRLC